MVFLIIPQDTHQICVIALGQPIILSQQAFLCQRVKSTGIFKHTRYISQRADFVATGEFLFETGHFISCVMDINLATLNGPLAY